MRAPSRGTAGCAGPSVAAATSACDSAAAVRAFTVVDRVPELRARLRIAFELHDRIGEHRALLRFDRHASGADEKHDHDEHLHGCPFHQKYTPNPPEYVWAFLKVSAAKSVRFVTSRLT